MSEICNSRIFDMVFFQRETYGDKTLSQANYTLYTDGS